jgi:hypothetical protein
MKVTIEFDCDNAAFEENFYIEMDYVMDCIKRKIFQQRERAVSLCDAPEAADKILDHNGNSIGFVHLDGKIPCGGENHD